jgi:hypothetical protein
VNLKDPHEPHESEMGLFGGSLGEQAPRLPDHPEPSPPEEAPPEEGYRNPARVRRALRRLQDRPPNDFEKVIDLLYEWREHIPAAQVTDVMRKLLAQNHNMSDQNAISAMKGIIREARKVKIDEAITRLGFDEAERVLGLKSEEPEEDPGRNSR